MNENYSATTSIAPSGAGKRPVNGIIFWLLGIFTAVHAALYLFLPDTAARFMLGDRAHDRTYKLEQLQAAANWGDFLRVLFFQGAPGDYIVFQPAYTLAGVDGVILQNFLFYLVAIWFLFRFCEEYFSSSLAVLTVVAWCLLPSTIFHPHAFVSEAICNPLLIVATLYSARILLAPDLNARWLLIAGLALAALAFVRHVYLLLPLAAAGLIVLAGAGPLPRRAGKALALLALSFSMVASWAWLAGRYQATYPAGVSVGGLQSNLFLRAERMAAMGGFELPASVEARQRKMPAGPRMLEVGEYLDLVGEHPGVYLRSVASDAFNLVANPGMAMVAGRFLGVFDLGEHSIKDLNKWREIRERHGFVALLKEIWRTSPVGLVVNICGGLVWLCVLMLALLGGLHFAADWRQAGGLRLLLWGLVFYVIVLTSMTAGYSRWDHRSPVEFVLVLFFAIGAEAIRHWRLERNIRRALAS